MLKLCICIVLLGVFTYGQQEIDAFGLPEPYNELPCLSFGGICVAAGECPEDLLSKSSGLCPVQQQRGVECCHSIPRSERRCRNRGGECMPKSNRCPDNLTYREAIDCNVDEKCCILV